MEKMGLPVRKPDECYTYAEYRTWPDEERWELIQGIAWSMSPAPSRRHQKIAMELGRQIANFLKGKGCQVYPAPFDVFFPEDPDQSLASVDTIVQPDLTVICDGEKLQEKGCVGAPDFIIEILSPYTSRKDLNEKFHLYEGSGVREYWVVDPAFRSLQAYRRGDKGIYGDGEILVREGTLASVVLEGFSIELSGLFAGLED